MLQQRRTHVNITSTVEKRIESVNVESELISTTSMWSKLTTFSCSKVNGCSGSCIFRIISNTSVATHGSRFILNSSRCAKSCDRLSSFAAYGWKMHCFINMLLFEELSFFPVCFMNPMGFCINEISPELFGALDDMRQNAWWIDSSSEVGSEEVGVVVCSGRLSLLRKWLAIKELPSSCVLLEFCAE